MVILKAGLKYILIILSIIGTFQTKCFFPINFTTGICNGMHCYFFASCQPLGQNSSLGINSLNFFRALISGIAHFVSWRRKKLVQYVSFYYQQQNPFLTPRQDSFFNLASTSKQHWYIFIAIQYVSISISIYIVYRYTIFLLIFS